MLVLRMLVLCYNRKDWLYHHNISPSTNIRKTDVYNTGIRTSTDINITKNLTLVLELMPSENALL